MLNGLLVAHPKTWWATLLLIVVGGCAWPGRPSLVSPSADQQSDRPDTEVGVARFHRVDESLYRGGQPDADGFTALAERGIKTVVCLRVLHSDRDLAEDLGLNYRRISMKLVHPEYEDVLEFLRIVTNPANVPVFVHCRQGVDRTGLMVAAYRMVVQGWTKQAAIAEMEAKGFHDVNMIMKRFLVNLDVQGLRQELSRRPAGSDGALAG